MHLPVGSCRGRGRSFAERIGSSERQSWCHRPLQTETYDSWETYWWNRLPRDNIFRTWQYHWLYWNSTFILQSPEFSYVLHAHLPQVIPTILSSSNFIELLWLGLNNRYTRATAQQVGFIRGRAVFIQRSTHRGQDLWRTGCRAYNWCNCDTTLVDQCWNHCPCSWPCICKWISSMFCNWVLTRNNARFMSVVGLRLGLLVVY